MSRVGKKLAASMATIICIAFVMSAAVPLSGAQSTALPVTNASISGTQGLNGWYTSSVTVSLSATDVGGPGIAHTYYRLNNTQYTYASSFTMPEGDTRLAFWSVDTAGNVENLNDGRNNIHVKVDTQLPIVNITIKGKQNTTTGSYIGAPTVNFTATDNSSGVYYIQYSYDGSTWANYTANFSLTTDGMVNLRYRAYDNAGNVNETSTIIKVFSPAINATPPFSSWNIGDSSNNILGVMFTMPSYIDHVDHSYDNKTWFSGSFDLLGEGKHQFYYRAVSGFGDGKPADIAYGNVWIGIDDNSPWIDDCSISGSQDSKNGWWNGDIKITLNPHDNGSIKKSQWSWDKTTWYDYNGQFTVGWGKTRTIYYRTYDMFDREANGSHWIYFAPGSYYQGAMSDSVWVNGVLYGPSSGNSGNSGSSTESPTSTPSDDNIPWPTTTTQNPTPTAAAQATTTGTGTPLALAVVVGVLALIIVAAAAAYFFMLKPK